MENTVGESYSPANIIRRWAKHGNSRHYRGRAKVKSHVVNLVYKFMRDGCKVINITIFDWKLC